MKRWRVPAAGVALALILVAFYFIGVWGPRSEKIGELDGEAGQLRSQQVPLRRDIAGLEEVARREGQFRSALQRLEELIPSGIAQPTLLSEMQAAAERAGVEVVSVSFGEPQVSQGAPQSPMPGTVLVAMPVTVIVNGSFLGIIDLLWRVEMDVHRAVLVGTVAFTEADAGFPELTGTWSGQAYALLPAEDPLIAGVAKPAAPGASAPSPPTSPTSTTLGTR